jgi:uncharacterized protein (DUF2147 family)
MHSVDRRLFSLVLWAAAVGATSRASAGDASDLDGTWGGVKDGVTAQVIIAGGSVIGYFWRDDYLEAQSAKFSADGRSVTFGIHGGEATLTRTGAATATLDVREGSVITRLDLKRD